jgi:hypothetical protein
VDPAETSSGLLPHSIYIGSHADQSKEMKDEQKQGRWTELWVDYIRISRGAWVSLESKDCAAAHTTAPLQ